MRELVGKLDFENAVKQDIFILIDFWARWCAPCNAMMPIIEQVDKLKSGEIAFYKVDVDDDKNQELSVKFHIRSIPTVVIIKSGVETARSVGGFNNVKAFGEWIDSVISENK